VNGTLHLFDATLLNSTFRSLAPILLAALGGLICARAGVFNVALEGLMLFGAFAAVAGSYYAGNAWVGVLVAVVACVFVSGILSFGTVTMGGDPIVLGIALNLLAVGMTTFLLRVLFHVQGIFQNPRLKGLPRIGLPGIQHIPGVRTALSGETALVYLGWGLVIVAQIVLFRHAWGLRLRGVGEDPDAAATFGVDVRRYRHVAVALSGVLCGLAGAQLSLGNVTLFAENMSAGRGWIALVAVLLGRAHPIGVLGAAFLFGLADAIGFRLQGAGLPSQFTGALPYVVTLVALFGLRGRLRMALRGVG